MFVKDILSHSLVLVKHYFILFLSLTNINIFVTLSIKEV
nr:MAG TPA: hypothetical protein [Caudoviricetes sp.]